MTMTILMYYLIFGFCFNIFWLLNKNQNEYFVKEQREVFEEFSVVETKATWIYAYAIQTLFRVILFPLFIISWKKYEA